MSGARVRLRAARPADLPAIVAIERASFGDPWSEASFASLVDNPLVWFLVAELVGVASGQPSGPATGGAIAGYLVAWFVVDEGEIANVAVDPARRGLGLGARLVDAALAEGARRGTVALFLEVRASNATARRLYGSRGFVELGRRTRYYRHPVEDALVLRCALADRPRPASVGGGGEGAG